MTIGLSINCSAANKINEKIDPSFPDSRYSVTSSPGEGFMYQGHFINKKNNYVYDRYYNRKKNLYHLKFIYVKGG